MPGCTPARVLQIALHSLIDEVFGVGICGVLHSNGTGTHSRRHVHLSTGICIWDRRWRSGEYCNSAMPGWLQDQHRRRRFFLFDADRDTPHRIANRWGRRTGDEAAFQRIWSRNRDANGSICDRLAQLARRPLDRRRKREHRSPDGRSGGSCISRFVHRMRRSSRDCRNPRQPVAGMVRT